MFFCWATSQSWAMKGMKKCKSRWYKIYINTTYVLWKHWNWRKQYIIKWGSYFTLEESLLWAGHCPYRLPLLSPCLRCSIGCCLCVRFACVVSALFRRMSIERKEPALNGSVSRQLSSVWERKGLLWMQVTLCSLSLFCRLRNLKMI